MSTEQSEIKTSPPTLSDWLRQRGTKILAPVVNLLARLGFSPNAVTLIGLGLNIGVACLLAAGWLKWGGALMLVAGLFDSLDGALARQTGTKTLFGAFLDSTLDRYSEACALLGLAWFYLEQSERISVMLIVAALVGSIMVSYTRARAEGLGLSCKGGLLTRFERVLLISLGLISGLTQPMLWLLAVLANGTALQRIAIVWQATDRGKK